MLPYYDGRILTFYINIYLLSVPPRPPVIVDEFGVEVTSELIGPYAEGAASNISCEVSGGSFLGGSLEATLASEVIEKERY